jgi:NAD(P)-dependent dehydrogenase (short-subunit alcohol dehydrogenase family)
MNETVALVTGANRGIGRAFVEALAGAGAERIYASARAAGSLDELVAIDPDRIVPVVLDVTDDWQITAAAARAGDVTLLVNNAGVGLYAKTIDDDGFEAAHTEMDVNYYGVVRMMRAFAPVLKGNGGGTIVNILSVGALLGFPFAGTYFASKAAAWSATQSARAELRPAGTQVIGVFPGPIDTRMAEGVEMEKAPPSVVATATLAAIAEGVEEVFPDPMAKEFREALAADPKALERQFGEMPAE